MPDAEAQTPEVGRAELLGDRLQAVMTGISAALLDAHASRHEIHFVMNNENLLGLDLVVVRDRRDAFSRAIHESERLQEPDFFSGDACAGNFTLEFGLIAKCSAVLVGEGIEKAKASVVSCSLILGPGIAEPDDETNGSVCHVSKKSQNK